MTNDRLNWDDLRYFLALARNGTMSEAGRELRVKHTTVARRIKSLEQNLASRLFDHLPQGYAMTQVGENLYQHALEMEQRAFAVNREVLGSDTQLSGALNLTASHNVASVLITPHLTKFHQNYPEVELNLLCSIDLADLTVRQADIAIRLTAKPPQHLIGKKLLPLRHGIYASTQYLTQAPKTPQVILWLGESQQTDWLVKSFENVKVMMRADDITTILSCVENHMGLARLPCFVGDSSAQLKRLDIALPPSDWGIWMLSHVDLRATARVRVCREFLADTIQDNRCLVEGLNSHYW